MLPRGLAGVLAASAVLLAPLAQAEEDCGSMVRTLARFRGRVRSVEPLTKRTVNVTVVESRPQFVVSMDIREVADASPPLRAGERREFAVHSPSRTIAPERLIGKTYDLTMVRVECDGAFRRFEQLRRRPPIDAALDVTDVLEVGGIYRTEVTWDPIAGPQPVKPLVEVTWRNADAFRAAAPPTIIFEVSRQSQARYELTILAGR